MKLGLILIASVLVLGFVGGLIRSLVAFVTPLAILAGIGLIVYGMVSRKALGASKRRYLP